MSKYISYPPRTICFQRDATWTLHVQLIHERATKRLNILRMLKYKVKRKNLVKIYFAFIRPVMEYSDVVWDNCTEKDSKLLEYVQVEAGRITIDRLRYIPPDQNCMMN